MKKKSDIIAVLVIAALVITGSMVKIHIARAEPLDTYHGEWNLIRATADEDGATFAAVYDLTGVSTPSGNFDSKDSSTVANGGPFHIVAKNPAGGYGSPVSQGGVYLFSIAGKNYNNIDDTFSFNIVGWSRTNGMLQMLAEGDGVLGTQAVVEYPNDGSDAMGELVSETAVTYTHASTTFTVTNDGFAGVVAGMLARVTGTNLTNAIVQVTTATDDNNIICSGITSTDNNTDSTVQINPAFWADTITLDETTKWPVVSVFNATGDDEVALVAVDTTGLEWVQFVIYDADAATDEQAGDITVFGRRY